MTSKYNLIILSCFILKQALVAQVVPPPATQAEVDAGLNRFKYVTPRTLANSGLISGPTNGITATTATNIAAAGDAILQAQLDLAPTNYSAQGFRFSNRFLESYGPDWRMAGLEFYDSFEREGLTNYPGISDSGHIWGHAAIGTTTNLVFIKDGEFRHATNGPTGAHYWGVTRTNLNVNWNWFGGTVKYRGLANNGFEDTATIILCRSLDFNTSQPYLHFRVGRSWLQVQLSQTNTILNENFPIPLTNNVFYTFNCYVLSNRLVAEIGNYKYEITNDSLAQESITNATVLIYEHNRRMTNLTSGYYASYGDAWAGTMPFHMQRYMSDGINRGSNGVILSTLFSDGTVQSTAASNSVMVAAGTGGITVTPSGSGGVMTYTISDDDAGGGGGGGGTNFPNVNLLLGGTNLTLSAGVRKAYHNQTNGSHGINLNLAVPESGYEVVYSVSNSGSSDITVTFYTNSVAANLYHIGTKTNVNTFTASASGVTKAWLSYTAPGLWTIDRIEGPTRTLIFGSGITSVTQGVNGLDVTISAAPRFMIPLASGSGGVMASNVAYHFGGNSSFSPLTDISFDSGRQRMLRAPFTGTIKRAFVCLAVNDDAASGSADAIVFGVTNITATTFGQIASHSSSNQVRMVSSSSMTLAVTEGDLIMGMAIMPSSFTNKPSTSSFFFTGSLELE